MPAQARKGRLRAAYCLAAACVRWSCCDARRLHAGCVIPPDGMGLNWALLLQADNFNRRVQYFDAASGSYLGQVMSKASCDCARAYAAAACSPGTWMLLIRWFVLAPCPSPACRPGAVAESPQSAWPLICPVHCARMQFSGTRVGDIGLPTRLAVTADSSIVVSRTPRHATPRRGARFCAGVLPACSLCLAPRNQPTAQLSWVQVAEFSNNRFQRLSATGAQQLTFGSPGSGPGQFDDPSESALRVGAVWQPGSVPCVHPVCMLCTCCASIRALCVCTRGPCCLELPRAARQVFGGRPGRLARSAIGLPLQRLTDEASIHPARALLGRN